MQRARDMDDAWGAWMRAGQGGDTAAYRHLLTEIAAAVRGFIRHRWGAFDGVEDVVQDVLLSVHTVRHTYDPVRPFRPWLFAIVRHRMADAARRHARKAAHEMTVEVLPEVFSGAEDSPWEHDEIHRLRQAIATLPPGQRQAVEMLKLAEMSLKEAAAASGQSVAALKVAMHRALKTLKTRLGERS